MPIRSSLYCDRRRFYQVPIKFCRSPSNWLLGWLFAPSSFIFTHHLKLDTSFRRFKWWRNFEAQFQFCSTSVILFITQFLYSSQAAKGRLMHLLLACFSCDFTSCHIYFCLSAECFPSANILDQNNKTLWLFFYKRLGSSRPHFSQTCRLFSRSLWT